MEETLGGKKCHSLVPLLKLLSGRECKNNVDIQECVNDD